MSESPRTPYPPDVEDAEPKTAELGDLVDAVVAEADWANERAARVSLLRVELRRCRLTGVELAEATFRDVVFDECRLDLAGIRHAKLERVAFRDCRLEECDFYGTTLKDVQFERCALREATFSNCTIDRVEIRACDLAGLRGVEALRGVRMPWPDAVENAALFAAAAGIELLDS